MTGDPIMCDGKMEYRSYWKAHREAIKLNRRRDGSKLNPYKCPGTHHFHIGNTLGKMRKRQPNRHTLKEIAQNGRKKIPKYSR